MYSVSLRPAPTFSVCMDLPFLKLTSEQKLAFGRSTLLPNHAWPNVPALTVFSVTTGAFGMLRQPLVTLRKSEWRLEKSSVMPLLEMMGSLLSYIAECKLGNFTHSIRVVQKQEPGGRHEYEFRSVHSLLSLGRGLPGRTTFR